MAKNILIILDNGRVHGNTQQLAEAFARGAEAAGHNVKTISLREKTVNGCLGCNACRYGKPCIQKDDFNDIVPDIKAADLLVFASPLFFWTISARTKAFNYIGMHDRGMLLAPGCGGSSGRPRIAETDNLDRAYDFGLNIYKE